MKVYEAIADALVDSGVDTMFTLIGDESAEMTGHAVRRGVRVVTTRHETGTVGMADGYARRSGRVGVAVVARGPGLTNALTASICAARAGSPVVIIAGDSALAWAALEPAEALERDRSHKYVPQQRLLDSAMVRSVTLTSAASAAATIRTILASATTDGTTVVNIPIDVMRAEVGELAPAAPVAAHRPPTPPDPVVIERVAGRLRAAERPVIVAGRGAVRSGAREALVSLAERSGALLATTLLAKGFFAGDPFDVGVAGGLASQTGLSLLREADLVVAFGSSLNPMTMYGGDIFPDADIVHVDASEEAFGRFTAVADRVVGDARVVAEALTAALDSAERPGRGARTADVAERLAGDPFPSGLVDQGRPGAIDPRLLMLRLDHLLPEARTIVVDSGRQLTFPSTYLRAREPGSYLFPHDGGALGAALGVGIGAAVADPGRWTVICLGDGALMMSLADLDTAVRYRLPVLIVVSNNAGFGGAMVTLHEEGLPGDAARYANPSFAAIAESVGARGITVSRLEDLDALVGMLDPAGGPIVLDCQTTSDVVPEWVEFIERLHRAQATA